MITLQQWRCVIGGFHHPLSGRMSDPNELFFAKRWVVIAATLVILPFIDFSLFHIESCVTTSARSTVVFDCVISNHTSTTSVCQANISEHFKLFDFDKLLISMDVESNPGPAITLDEINRNILRMHEDIQHVREDVRRIRRDVEENHMKINDLQARTDEYEYRNDENMEELHDRIEYLERRNEMQERYSRRENIVLKGVPVTSNESSIKQQVVDMFNSLGGPKVWSTDDFQRAHRLNRTGHIIVRFVLFEDKLRALKFRDKLNDKRIRLTNDLTVDQRNQLYKLRAENKVGYFKGNRLIVESSPTPAETNRAEHSTANDNEGASGGGGGASSSHGVGNVAFDDLSSAYQGQDSGRDYDDGSERADSVRSFSTAVQNGGRSRGRGSGPGSSGVGAGGSRVFPRDRDRELDRPTRRGAGSGDRQHVFASHNSLPRRGAGRGRSGRAASELHSRDHRGGGRLDNWLHRESRHNNSDSFSENRDHSADFTDRV